MWSNYLKIALRNLVRYRGSNVINIFGLALGLACCVLCYLHISFELGFDSFHEKKDRIARVVNGDMTGPDAWVKISPPVPPLIKQSIPEIEKFARFSSVTYSPKVVVESEGKTFSESYFMMADPAFLEMFSFPLVKGSAEGLSDLNSVLISETSARKLFGQDDPLGKVIRLKDSNLDFQVAGVTADVPEQSHLRFDYLISFENLDRIFGEGRSKAWGEFNYFNYFLLAANADKTTVESKIHEISIPLSDGTERKLDQVFLQSLSDIHFQDNRGNMLPSYDKKYIYIFSAIAIALLAIACINYINLAIALSIKRVKEIGVRKAVGAGKFQLTSQFLSESFLTIIIALGASLILIEIALPLLNPGLDSHLSVHYKDPAFISYLTAIVLTVGLVSGSYLAFYANSHKTASILKGAPRGTRRGFSLQHVLVFAQFSISLILIISSLIISDQLHFIQNKKIGLDYQQVVNVSLYSRPENSVVQTLKDELKKDANIVDATASSFLPGRANWHQTVWWEGQTEDYSMYILSVDRDFFRTMRVKLVEGSSSTIESSATQGNQYILNESAKKVIGWDHALGKAFSPFGEKRKLPIAGVVEDFNFKSLHHGLDPLVIVVTDQLAHNQLSIRINEQRAQQTLSFIEDEFKKVLPGTPFEYEFLDEKFAQLYKSEIRLGRVVSWLTVLSVFFSLMGLYGLISFNIENKTKDIAVRKALGVSLTNLMVLFSKDYFRLLAFGAVVSVPVTYYLITTWLENFTYKVTPSPGLFVAAYAIVFSALGVLILVKSFAFGKINPAQALKYE